MSRKLTRQQMTSLVLRAQGGDPRAMEDAIAANSGLVSKFAGWFIRHCRHMELDDLVQYGRLGLLKAIRDFDPARGHTWATCASKYITNEIMRELQHDTTIRIPCHVWEKRRKDGRDVPGVIRSLDEPATGGRPNDTGEAYSAFGDLLASDDDTQAAALRNLEIEEAAATAERLLAPLKPRQATVLRLRYGLDGHGKRSLQQVADILGCTRERVRQIQALAVATIKKNEGQGL